jgi:solute carrier family 35
MYLVLVEKSGAEDGLSSIELMYYNGLLSLPFLLLVIIATGEFPSSFSVLSDKVSHKKEKLLVPFKYLIVAIIICF